jgi:bifunctional oligoribonuclease and PAP phosphatase NrnA
MQKKIIGLLKKHQAFVVTTHVHPDADALGSALAMAIYLKSMGKKVRLFNEDECPTWLGFMPRVGLYEQFTGGEKFTPEVVVVLDCGDLERIGKVRELLKAGVKVVNIDHHVTNVDFGDLNLVRSDYSSSSEIVYDLLESSGFRLTKDVATQLYLGILTDTGSFGFDCTSAHTHQVVSELLKFQLPVSDLYRRVYETMPNRDLKPFFALVHRIELYFKERVACLVMRKRDAEDFSGEFDLRDKIFSFLRSVKGLEVIVVITETEKAHRVRINFRSRDGFDVAKLAERYGGGGHKKASGCYMNLNAAGARREILAAIRKGL